MSLSRFSRRSSVVGTSPMQARCLLSQIQNSDTNKRPEKVTITLGSQGMHAIFGGMRFAPKCGTKGKITPSEFMKLNAQFYFGLPGGVMAPSRLHLWPR
jgi:hypothetical protein